MSNPTPLKPPHAEINLSVAKLAMFARLESDVLKSSLAPGQEHCVKARPDGTMLARISHLCEMGLFFVGILGEFRCLLGYEWGLSDLGSVFRAMGAARSGFEARLVFAMGF